VIKLKRKNFRAEAIIKFSIIPGIIFNPVTGKNMELSRIQQAMSGNKEKPDNTQHAFHPEKTEKKILIAPDQLFNSSGNFKVALKPLPTLDFSGMNNSGQKLINENTRVLHIGDSHTAGIYGSNIDKMMRATGAKVFTLASSGSSAASWIDGYTTKSGFYYHDETGKNSVPQDWKVMTPAIAEKLKNHKIKDWQVPVKTPNVNDMIDKFKPNVIVFSLGANMIHNSAKSIEADVRRLCEIAKASGAKIVWVGPPDGRPDKKPDNVQNNLYEHIQKIAEEYGAFIDSRPYTDFPAGIPGDGVHYWNPPGKHIDASGKPYDLEKTARDWAKSIFDEIQK
jgi:hypothetical protein